MLNGYAYTHSNVISADLQRGELERAGIIFTGKHKVKVKPSVL